MGIVVAVVLLFVLWLVIVWWCGEVFGDDADNAAIAQYERERAAFEDLFE